MVGIKRDIQFFSNNVVSQRRWLTTTTPLAYHNNAVGLPQQRRWLTTKITDLVLFRGSSRRKISSRVVCEVSHGGAYLRGNFGLYRCTVPLSVVIKEITRKKTVLHMRILNTEQLQ